MNRENLMKCPFLNTESLKQRQNRKEAQTTLSGLVSSNAPLKSSETCFMVGIKRSSSKDS